MTPLLVTRPPGGTWSSRPLVPDADASGEVRAVADDGTSTFVLWQGFSKSDPAPLMLSRVRHGGPPSQPQVLDTEGRLTYDPSLIARDGRWWAVWQRQTGHEGSANSTYTVVRQARTIEPAFTTRPLVPDSGQDTAPRLAWRDGSPVVALSRLGRVVVGTTDSSGTFVQQADLGEGALQDLVATPDETVLVWLRGDALEVGRARPGEGFQTSQVPTDRVVFGRPARLSVTPGQVIAGFTTDVAVPDSGPAGRHEMHANVSVSREGAAFQTEVLPRPTGNSALLSELTAAPGTPDCGDLGGPGRLQPRCAAVDPASPCRKATRLCRGRADLSSRPVLTTWPRPLTGQSWLSARGSARPRGGVSRIGDIGPLYETGRAGRKPARATRRPPTHVRVRSALGRRRVP